MYNLCNIRLNLFPGVGAPVVTGSRQSKLPELMRINLLLDCSVRMSGTQTLAEVMVIKSMNIGLNKVFKMELHTLDYCCKSIRGKTNK